jgi:hypothetical protein
MFAQLKSSEASSVRECFPEIRHIIAPLADASEAAGFAKVVMPSSQTDAGFERSA